MREFSSRRADEIHRQLHALECSRPWVGWGSDPNVVCSFLAECAEAAEAEAIPSAIGCLFHADATVRSTARSTLASLLSLIAPYDLLHLGQAVTRFDDSQHAWQTLKRQDIAGLATDAVVQNRIAVLGLASFHHSGYVRQAAVGQLAEIDDGGEFPFLVIRSNDWVQNVAAEAQAALRRRITIANLPHLVRSLKLVLHLQSQSRRDHSDTLRRTVDLLLLPEHDDILQRALASQDRSNARAVLRLGLEVGGPARERLLSHALNALDDVVRAHACRSLSEEFSTELAHVIERARYDVSVMVRREALLAHARHFPSEATTTWQAALLDPSASIRDLARFHLREWGGGRLASVCRAAVAENPDRLAAVQGLAETAEITDLPLFRRLLHHRFPTRRSAAIRGLVRANDELLAADITPCLHDESPAVVREARIALRPHMHLVEDELLFATATKASHPFARRSAVGMLADRGKWRSLPWLIRVVSDADDATSRSAEGEITEWCSSPKCNRMFLRPSAEERLAIRNALTNASKRVSDELRAAILTEIGEPPPISEAARTDSQSTRDLPSFVEGMRRWTEFLAAQGGLTAEPLWVFREDIVERWPALFVRTPLANPLSVIERIYERGRRGGIGISLEVVCLLEQHPCCYLWLPQNEEQAMYRMVAGLKMSIPTDSSLRTATPVNNLVRWKWLKCREQWEGKTRWVDGVPARASYES